MPTFILWRDGVKVRWRAWQALRRSGASPGAARELRRPRARSAAAQLGEVVGANIAGIEDLLRKNGAKEARRCHHGLLCVRGWRMSAGRSGSDAFCSCFGRGRRRNSSCRARTRRRRRGRLLEPGRRGCGERRRAAATATAACCSSSRREASPTSPRQRAAGSTSPTSEQRAATNRLPLTAACRAVAVVVATGRGRWAPDTEWSGGWWWVSSNRQFSAVPPCSASHTKAAAGRRDLHGRIESIADGAETSRMTTGARTIN